MTKVLYVVSTPIGNMKDITYRAIETLSSSYVIICEDTRVTQKLLSHYSIFNKKLIVYNDFKGSVEEVYKYIIEHNKASLVSDAGTPLISDPGYKLISYLVKNGIKIEPVPGASSPIAALCGAAIATDKFMFCGFVPTKSKDKFFIPLVNINTTLIFFESATRLKNTLIDLLKYFGNRRIAIAREITKMHEEFIRTDLNTALNINITLKGEIIIILDNSECKVKKDTVEEDISRLKTKAEIYQYISAKLGCSKNALYRLLNKTEQ